MKRLGIKKAVVIAAVCMPFIAVAQTQPLSLKHGVYVQMSYECVGAPNAAVMFWDGIGFAGAHSSKCVSDLQSKDGRQFQVSTTCSALGDGSPDTSGHVDSFTLTRQSSDRFEAVRAGRPSFTYRWCGAQEPK